MTFATEVTKNGHGACFQLEVSADRFGSVFEFYSTVAHHYGAVDYEPRIVSIGRVQRGLTNDHNLAASTVEVVLDNTDGLVDWLVDRSDFEATAIKTKFRLYVVAYDPATLSLQRQQVGQFGMLDFPKRGPKTVTLMLADDTSVDGAEFALVPSLKDWVTDAGSTHTNNPLCVSDSTLVPQPSFYTPYELPLQLAFGAIYIPCQKTLDAPIPLTDSNYDRRALIVCVTTDTGSVTANDVQDLRLVVKGDDPISKSFNGLSVPQSFSRGSFPGTIWSAARSQTLTKDGRSWKIIWVDLHLVKLLGFLRQKATLNTGAIQAGSAWPDWLQNTTYSASNLYEFLDFTVAGYPYSSRTTPSSSVGSFGSGVRAPEIAYDLLAYYSHGLTTGDVDAASFTRAAQVLPGFYASGVINDIAELTPLRDPASLDGNQRIMVNFTSTEQVGGRLRQTLAELSRSGSFDIFVSWAGLFAATMQASNFTDQLGISSLLELDETLIVDGEWEDRIPSPGERWAPHNRLYIEGADGRLGPFDNAAAVAAWGRKLPVTLSTKWVSPADYAQLATNPNLSLFNTAQLESKARQRLKFTYGSLEALQLDLGSYFKMSIKRGTALNPIFSSAIFKVEQIDLLPSTLGVYIEAIWFDDLTTDRPYFLDDETYSIVGVGSSGHGGRTATVTDSSTTITFSSGSLISDGVQAGDIFIMLDTSLADGVFTRYRAVRIASVTDATHLVLTSSDLDFDAPSGHAVSQWEIHRGATTYSQLHTSDPTHYPTTDYPPLYGKVTNTGGTFSDSSAGNKLLDG